ncbi:MAG: hypothetical protein WD073_05670 [Xanthobacteraceae bacterium]
MLILGLLGGCANGDFGRIKPSLVNDDIHSWLGTETTGSIGAAALHKELTDDERELRDLAYPLLEPPFDRQRWYSILGEYGITRNFETPWAPADRTAYSRELMAKSYRSPQGRYERLIEDIRNDVVRIGPFFRISMRVTDMDNKREQSLAFIPDLGEEDRAHALNRVAENRLITEWVYRSLSARASAYRYALERLVVASPSPQAVEAERAWKQMRMMIGENPAAAGPDPAAYRQDEAGLKRLSAK